MPYLPKSQQALAPLDNIGVGRILQDEVKGIGDEAPNALRAKGVPVQDGPRLFLVDELPAALAWISTCSMQCSKDRQQAPLTSTCGMLQGCIGSKPPRPCVPNVFLHCINHAFSSWLTSLHKYDGPANLCQTSVHSLQYTHHSGVVS